MTVRDNRKRTVSIGVDSRHTITVGVHSAEGGAGHGRTTVGEIAMIHEFGLGVPQRSFVRSWVDGNKGRNKAILERAVKSTLGKGTRTPYQAAHWAGSVMASDCAGRIRAGAITPPLSPVTIKRKRSSTPLLDTGALSAGIKYYVDGVKGVP